MMTIADATAPAATTPGTSLTAATITSVKAPASEPTETKRVAITVITKTTEAITSASGASTANAPAAVATPFPPRNRSQTGYTCPTTEANAATTAVTRLADNTCAINTATVPFTPSSTIARTAALTPEVRSTFEAPTLPLPA